MEFGLSEEQRALEEAIADLLATHAHPRAAYDDQGAPIDAKLWGRLCELGVPGLAVPEEYDGAGAGPVELALVSEHLGHHVAPVPVLGHVAAVELLRSDEALAKELLPDLASGVRRATLIPAGDGVDPSPAIHIETTMGLRLTGAARVVIDAIDSDLFVVPVEGDGGVLDWYVVEAGPGVGVTQQPSLDRTRPVATVTLGDAPGRRIAASQDAAPRALALLRTLAASEAVGIAAWALEQTRRYANSREQFGLPIGTFQAVKHRLADMMVAVENARSAVYGAAWALAADGTTEATTAVSMAQAVATEAAVRVSSDAIQLHGGVGVTWESDLHLRLRRAKTLQLMYGSPSWHRARVATELLDAPVER